MLNVLNLLKENRISCSKDFSLEIGMVFLFSIVLTLKFWQDWNVFLQFNTDLTRSSLMSECSCHFPFWFVKFIHILNLTRDELDTSEKWENIEEK